MSLPRSVSGWLLVLFGLSLITFAALVDHSQYATLLQLEKRHELEWGPALFRVLLLLHGLAIVVAALFRDKIPGLAGGMKGAGQSAIGLSRKEIVFLISLAVLALLLRVPNLDSHLWVDEVLTLVDFVRAPWGEVVSSFPSQNQHMLYTLLAKLSASVFEESAWAIRLPAVLFGVGSIGALYFLGRKLLGVRAAVLGSLLMTVSYHHVWFSQNARGYTGLLFFAILATWIWLEALERDDWALWIAYSVSVALGMWVHMTMAFVVAGHGIAFISAVLFRSFRIGPQTERDLISVKAATRPMVAWLLAISITLQLYAIALPEFLSEALHEESRNSLWTNPSWVVNEILGAFNIGGGGLIVISGGLVFMGLGVVGLFRRNRQAAILMVISPLLSGAVMLILGHNLFPRFFFFSAGFAILIVLEGASALATLITPLVRVLYSSDRLADLIGTGLVGLMIIVSAGTVPRNYNLPKQDFPSAYDYVELHRAKGEEVVAVSIAGKMYSDYFGPKWLKADTVGDLKKIQGEYGKLWLVYTLSPEIEAFHPEMWKIIERDYSVVKMFPGTLNGGEVVVCKRKGQL